ncbi:MAG: MBL fold metallo-hydrolase [Ruminococcus sp.]|nr:MBL fold metallo-hydrolase [Ruminococcus sp.]
MKKLAILIMTVLTAVFMLSSCAENEQPPQKIRTQVSEDLIVYSFSLGKADAHLIYNSQFAVLIDCGEKGQGKEILDYMEENDIPSLDYLIITHFDKDHVGGAAKILKAGVVKNVLCSNYPKESEEYSSYREQLSKQGLEAVTVRESYRFSLGGAEFMADPPRAAEYPTDPSNNSSLIVSLFYGENALLFAGDAEDLRLAEFTAANEFDYDYLKVPYHGHFQERLREFLPDVRAESAVITSSDKEPEDSRTVELLENSGAEVFLTRTAAVRAVCDGRTVKVSYDVPQGS